MAVETVAEKSKGQILYEQHAAEAHLKSPWKSLGQENQERYERKALSPKGHIDWDVLNDISNRLQVEHIKQFAQPEVKEQWGVKGKKERKPYTKSTKTNKSTVKVSEKDGNSTKAILPPWSEMKAESDFVKIKWLDLVSCLGVKVKL